MSWETLNFRNGALQDLPLDPEHGMFHRQVTGACFTRASPTPVDRPRLVAFSESALKNLDLGADQVRRAEALQYLSAEKLMPGSFPAAHCYCGHQYGIFAGQLGDGATVYLGEIVNSEGENIELQLKGAGLTPFSRPSTDGRKVLRSSIREFLCSEAVHHLGIPTTRGVALVTSQTKVTRDMFYDDNPRSEDAAVLLRAAPTFLRFGSIEICNDCDPVSGLPGPSAGRKDILCKILDFTIKYFYPEIGKEKSSKTEQYLELFEEVVIRTAKLVAMWQAVGFCHGVLNTDNMSMVGLTMDYGPFAFMETYNPDHICNSSDYWARFSYRRQPEMCKWNCERLAQTMSLVAPLDQLRERLAVFERVYSANYHQIMMKKLGLKKAIPGDSDLIDRLLTTMQQTGADYTNTFLHLTGSSLSGDLAGVEAEVQQLTERLLADCCDVSVLKHMYRRLPHPDCEIVRNSMWVIKSNPKLLPNYWNLACEATDQLNQRDFLEKIEALTASEKKQNDVRLWTAWLKSYAKRLQADLDKTQNLYAQEKERKALMRSVNPRFVLRNYMAQDAIEAAKTGDFTQVNNLLQALENPYGYKENFAVENFTDIRPDLNLQIQIT